MVIFYTHQVNTFLFCCFLFVFFFSSRRRHTRFSRDWSSDVCSSDLSKNRVSYCRIPCDNLLRVPFHILVNQTGYGWFRQRHRLRSEERRVGKECRSRWAT